MGIHEVYKVRNLQTPGTFIYAWVH